jgi:hypothetical protein
MAVLPLLSTASTFHSTLSGSSGAGATRAAARHRHAWEASCALAQQAAPPQSAGPRGIQSYAASRFRCPAYPSTLQTHRKEDRVTCRLPPSLPARASPGRAPHPRVPRHTLQARGACTLHAAPTALTRAAPGAQAEHRRLSPPFPRCGACFPSAEARRAFL